MQNDLVTGPLGTPEARELIPKVQKKLDSYLEENKFIIFTQDTHYADYLSTQEGKNLPVEHCLYKSEGWQIIPELDRTPNIKIFNALKDSFGYGHWIAKGSILGITPNSGPKGCVGADMDIEIVGIYTDNSVVTNALLLKSTFPEAKITVDASCCAGTTPEKHQASLEVMKSCQITIINE